MNAIATVQPTDEEIIRVLENSLYPGAKPESIALVLSYCRVNGIDPMLKPVHIVPTSVKTANGWQMRDVLMPGIADYRIKAARSGDYVGKSEPMFGPDVTAKVGSTQITYPRFCKVIVSRYVHGEVRNFPAVEYWLENYATKGRDDDSPNRMWSKRPYAQLAKCAEAQALRMAFPELSGGAPTAEEMEGKHDGPTIEHQAQPEPTLRDRINSEIPMDKPKPKRTPEDLLNAMEKAIRDCPDIHAVNKIVGSNYVGQWRREWSDADIGRLEGIIAAGIAAHAPVEHAETEEDDRSDGWPGPLPSDFQPEREAADA